MLLAISVRSPSPLKQHCWGMPSAVAPPSHPTSRSSERARVRNRACLGRGRTVAGEQKHRRGDPWGNDAGRCVGLAECTQECNERVLMGWRRKVLKREGLSISPWKGTSNDAGTLNSGEREREASSPATSRTTGLQKRTADHWDVAARPSHSRCGESSLEGEWTGRPDLPLIRRARRPAP